jgi:hypothetical protein
MPEYFSHDYDAREDDKVIGLMSEMGWAGYGLYWGIIELMYKNNGKLRADYNRIAFALSSHPDHVKDLIENYELFKIKKGFVTNSSIEKRLKVREQKKQVASANAHERWKKHNANAMQTECKRNAKKNSKGKDNKVKNKEEYRSFAHLSITDTEYQKLTDLGYTEQQVNSIFDSIENYADNKKYKSLYLTARKWLEKEPKAKTKTW